MANMKAAFSHPSFLRQDSKGRLYRGKWPFRKLSLTPRMTPEEWRRHQEKKRRDPLSPIGETFEDGVRVMQLAMLDEDKMTRQ